MSKEELNVCLKSFYTCTRKKNGTYCKSSSIKSIRPSIDRFHSHAARQQTVSHYLWRDKYIIRTFVKGLRKTGSIAGVVDRKPISNVPEMWKLFDLINRARIGREQKSHTTTEDVLLFGRRGRDNQRQPAQTILSFQNTPQRVLFVCLFLFFWAEPK